MKPVRWLSDSRLAVLGASRRLLFEFLSELSQNGLYQRWRDKEAGVAQRLINRGGGFQRGALSGEGDNSDGSDHGNRQEGCTAPSRSVVDDHATAGLP